MTNEEMRSKLEAAKELVDSVYYEACERPELREVERATSLIDGCILDCFELLKD